MGSRERNRMDYASASRILRRASTTEVIYDSMNRSPHAFHASGDSMWILFDWISNSRGCPICWLGEFSELDSLAISQDVVELCTKEGRLAANIFCSGSGIDGNNFFPTIAHQLTISVPHMEPFILQALQADPLILNRAPCRQLKALIIEPFMRLKHFRSSPMVIVIESLHACESVMEEVVALAEVLHDYQLPLKIFITSNFEVYTKAHWMSPRFPDLNRAFTLESQIHWKSWPTSISTEPSEPSLESLSLTRCRPKIYCNLFPLLKAKICNDSSRRRLCDDLQNHLDALVRLDPISSLIQCHSYREQLLQVALTLSTVEHKCIFEALERDDTEIVRLLEAALTSDTEKQNILRLQGDDAQGFLDLLQNVLDGDHWVEDKTIYSEARWLLVKLSENSSTLPAMLFIEGVTLLETEAISGGAFADIYRGSHRGVKVAIKRMRVFQRGQDRQKIHKLICREALVWQHLLHPHILPLFGVDADTFSPFLCLVSPWMENGTVLEHMKRHGWSTISCNRLLLQVAQGLEYLHSQNVVHGDLRGSNILIDQTKNVRIGDFGLNVFADRSMTCSDRHGSTRWMAPQLHNPEMFEKKFQRNCASDMYAFACVCLEVYTERVPFFNIPNDAAVMLQVLKGQRPDRPLDRPMPNSLWSIVEWCWSQEESDRPSIYVVAQLMASKSLSAW